MSTLTTSRSESVPTTRVHGVDVPTGLYIGGQWEQMGASFPVLNPATGQVIADVADGGPDDALRALDAAAAAQDGWRHVPPRARADLFHHAYALLQEKAGVIAQVMTAESGKPLSESRSEVRLSLGFFRWYAEQIAHVHGTYAEASNGGYRIITTHQPVGPSLLITPWNFPLLMIARKAGAALAAGCTALVKSAKETPLTCSLFVEVLHNAGFPPGVVNLVHTSHSAAISSAVMKDRRLRKISFTGSTAVGSTLLAQAAPGVVNASMELGGDGPLVVLEDADVERAAEQAVINKFRNAGQVCVAANRIIVDESIADAFTESFLRASRRLVVGDGFDPATSVGPIINAVQRDGVARLVDELRDADAQLLLGGNAVPGPGYFFEPTVFRVDDASAEVCHREMFAPIATIYRAAGTEDAIRFANDTKFGLAAYLFTNDISRAIAVSERLEFGMVGINRGVMADPAAAFGGIKASGLGREGGPDGIAEFLEPQYLALTVDEGTALK